MKKILLLCLIFILVGCGKKDCGYTFNGDMTNDYAKDALNCKSVTYTDKKNNFEIITTPTEDGKKFTAKINYRNYELYNMFQALELDNIKIYKRKDNMFIELHHNSNNNKFSLIITDLLGNVKDNRSFVSDIVFSDNNFTITENLIMFEVEGDLCKQFDSDTFVSRKTTYDYGTVKKIKTEDTKIKDICK